MYYHNVAKHSGRDYTCQVTLGYFWEPHWKSMGLPEISRVTWQVCQISFIYRGTLRVHVFPPSDVNECSSDPCVNGGSCTHGVGTDQFSCACKTGWVGERCETGRLLISRGGMDGDMISSIRECALLTAKYIRAKSVKNLTRLIGPYQMHKIFKI